MMRPAIELADVIRQFGDGFVEKFQPLGYHKGVLHAIASCRTSVLGGHIDRCCDCGHTRVSYNSCRNRHCPRCQQVDKERWVMARQADLLPVGYFHVVFTLPHVVNPYCLRFPKELYTVLFSAARDTLAAFSRDPRHLGAETGFIAVLHTWGQNLMLHPHLHCIVPAGGIMVNGNWKNARSNGNFLFPVKALSKVFRGKFRDGLKLVALKAGFEVTPQLLQQMHRSEWVVYAKEPFAGPDQVIEYLGRYSHRVAITNHRLVSVYGEKVTFRYKDYRDGNKQKLLELEATEFLRRFCLHILPKRFVKIRHYGFLSSRLKTSELRPLQGESGTGCKNESKGKPAWQEICRQKLGFDPELCPCCITGRMITIETFPPRPPPVRAKLPKNAAAKTTL